MAKYTCADPLPYDTKYIRKYFLSIVPDTHRAKLSRSNSTCFHTSPRGCMSLSLLPDKRGGAQQRRQTPVMSHPQSRAPFSNSSPVWLLLTLKLPAVHTHVSQEASSYPFLSLPLVPTTPSASTILVPTAYLSLSLSVLSTRQKVQWRQRTCFVFALILKM